MPIRYAIDNMPTGLGAAPEASVSQRITIDNWPTGFLDGSQARADFISRVLGIVKDSTGATPLLWVPNGTDSTTSTSDDENQATITHTGGSLATRFSALGRGYAVSFDGSTQYSTIPDAARFSFGDASNDSPFSILALVNVTNTANTRCILSKWLTSAHEWRFYVSTADLLSMGLEDESVPLEVTRSSAAAINQGQWALVGMTYDGTGGAAASDNIIQYQNGVAISSNAANGAGTYVAMENTTTKVTIGGVNPNTASQTFQGMLGGILLVNKKLTAGDMWQLYQAFLGYNDFLA